MWKFIQRFFSAERDKYRSLSLDGRRLLMSYVLYSAADPLVNLFVNSYFWRQAHQPNLLIAYNAAFFSFIAVGCFLNGLLLKRLRPTRLYWFGCILIGLVPLSVIFLRAIQLSTVLFFGCLYGIAAGFFWANRNFLTMKLTQSKDRLYFSSLESSLGTLAYIVVPACVGWLLALGGKTGWYASDQAYRLMSVVGFALVCWVGALAQRVSMNAPDCSQLRLSRITPAWRNLRLLEMLNGAQHALEGIIPTILILMFIGDEASLGTIQSISSILSALVIYAIGSYLDPKRRLVIFFVWVLTILFASSLVAAFFSALGAALYFAFTSLTGDFRWISVFTLMVDLVDHEETQTGACHYALLLDREIYLNFGRVAALLLFIAAEYAWPQFGLRYGLLFGSLLQIIVFCIAGPLDRDLRHVEPIELPRQEEQVA